MRTLSVQKWLIPAQSAVTGGQGTDEQFRQKLVLVILSIGILTFSVPAIALLHTVPSLTHDHSLPESLVFDAVYSSSAIFAAGQLLHVRYCGLTSAFKVVVIFFWWICILTLDITFHEVPWHFNISFLLILCVFLESEKDRILMNVLSVIILLVTVVYIAMRALAKGGVISHIYQSEQEPPGEISVDPLGILSEWTASAFPIIINFGFVKMYSHIARKEAQAKNKSVEVASLIASKLVNFDLDAAEALLGQADSMSPVHKPLSGLLRNLRSYRSFLPFALFSQAEHTDPPNANVADAMANQSTAWGHAATAVHKLREPTYSLREFSKDVTAAFPELQLYGLESDMCSSGHTGFEEYQRTMGAMYALYCLARLDMDGRALLSFGVDSDWKARTGPHGDGAEKMRQFYNSMDWEGLTRLLLNANLLMLTDSTSLFTPSQGISASSSVVSGAIWVAPQVTQGSTKSAKRLVLNHDRMMAMLVLTAIHDIMKNTCLLPTVQERHAPYSGIAAGNQILDHDLALAYILEQFPSLLPSYYGLEPGQRAPILFTQGKIGFNNGWLVQGEAPPGALFSKFKQVITEGCASESDISFYFTHWLTDLAGAEPFGSQPWPGAEKFVSKFPLRVLNAFLESFSFVQHLAAKSEVEVMEEYLENRWNSLVPSKLVLGEGYHLAATRLVLMAQGFEAEVVDALMGLKEADRDLIAAELALTGCQQQFRRAPTTVRSQPTGPALLVYYAPALIQKAGASQAGMALTVLARVYQAARELFPLHPLAAEKTAVIRIDALKVLTPVEIMSAGPWHLQQMSPADAVVTCGQMQVPGITSEGAPASIVKIWISSPDQVVETADLQ